CAVVAAVGWCKTEPAAAALRDQSQLSALPLAAFDPADTKSLAISRWMTFQAPDAVVEVDEENAHPIGPGNILVANWVTSLPFEAIGSTLRTAAGTGRGLGVDRTPHEVMRARVERDPLAMATLLAKRYPEQPSISYIPSVAWTNTLKLAATNGDRSLEQKVREQTAPWVTGGQPLFG